MGRRPVEAAKKSSTKGNGGKKNLLNHFDPGQTFLWISVYESYSGDRLDNFPPLGWKRKIMKKRGGE